MYATKYVPHKIVLTQQNTATCLETKYVEVIPSTLFLLTKFHVYGRGLHWALNLPESLIEATKHIKIKHIVFLRSNIKQSLGKLSRINL